MFTRALTLAALLMSGSAFAAPVTLKPADPQPKASDLARGLSVEYAYPGDVRTLADANKALRKGKAGTPLRGLSYLDTEEGEKALTSKKSQKVAASISGYIRFDSAGTYEVEFISNDGIAASIGGQPVALYDEIHACEPAGIQEVIVPKAGWYALEATYFQRKGTSCLMMDWNVGGRMEPVPDSAFAFKK